MNVRRRHIAGDFESAKMVAQKMGTHSAYGWVTIGEAVAQPMQILTFAALAAHQDYLAHRTPTVPHTQRVTYAEDIRDMVGIGTDRAGRFLNELRRMGILVGTGHAGYRMAWAPPE